MIIIGCVALVMPITMICVCNPLFDPGSLVWLKNSAKESKKGDKMKPHWLCPYKVVKCLDKSVVKIANPKTGVTLKKAATQCRLKHCYGLDDPDKSNSQPPSDKSDSRPPSDKSDSQPPFDESDSPPPSDMSDSLPPSNKSDGQPPSDKSDGQPPFDKSDGQLPSHVSGSPPPSNPQYSSTPRKKIGNRNCYVHINIVIIASVCVCK